MLKLVDIEAAKEVTLPSGVETGDVFTDDCGNVFVRAGGSSVVQLVTVQAPGRRAMRVRDFVAGRPEFVGSRLGAE
jgi:methionyl-tRNA formyltransferase